MNEVMAGFGPHEKVERMLASLCLSDAERQFARFAGLEIAETVADVFKESARRGNELDQACMAAAAMVALILIRHGPAESTRLAA